MNILFVSANNRNDYLDIEREQRTLLKLAEAGNHSLRFLPGAQIEDLMKMLGVKSDAEKPTELVSVENGTLNNFDVLHFAGHAEEGEGLKFRSEDDGADPVRLTGKKFNEILKASEEPIRLVVLNACQTQEAAEAIKETVDAAIGTEAKVQDETAKYFSSDFYGALNEDKNVLDAFKTATKVYSPSPYIESVLGNRPDWKPQESNDLLIDEVKGKIEGLGAFYASFYGDYIDEQIVELRQDLRTNNIVFWGLISLAVCMWIYLFQTKTGGVFWPNLTDALAAAFNPAIGETGVVSLQGFWGRIQELEAFAPILIAFFQKRILAHGSPRLEGLQRLKDTVQKWDDLPNEEQEMVRSVMHTSLTEKLTQ